MSETKSSPIVYEQCDVIYTTVGILPTSLYVVCICVFRMCVCVCDVLFHKYAITKYTNIKLNEEIFLDENII